MTDARKWTLLIGPGGTGVLPGENPGYEGVERVVVVPETEVVERDEINARERGRSLRLGQRADRLQQEVARLREQLGRRGSVTKTATHVGDKLARPRTPGGEEGTVIT